MDKKESFYDYVDQWLAGLRVDLANTNLNQSQLSELSIHGTTIGAFRVSGGKEAIAFSDGKVSEGALLQPLSLSYEKILDIDRKSVMLISGVPSIAKEYCKMVEIGIDNYEKLHEEPLSSRGKVRLIETIMMKNFGLAAQGLIVSPIFVTHDEGHGARIFTFSPEGSWVEKDYAMSGSGKIAQPLFLPAWQGRGWNIDLSREEGVDLARYIATTSPQLESASGGKVYIRIISSQGVEVVEETS